jgi:hypothetical protein
VHRQHHLDVRKAGDQIAHGGADGLERLAEALPPVGRHQHQARARVERPQRRGVELVVLSHRGEQGIDHGVAGEKHGVRRHALGQETVACGVGRSEVQVGQPGGEHPVHLLREGMIAVAGAQPGLDVAGGNPLQVGREGCGERRHRVALDQEDVWPHLPQQRRKPVEHPGRHPRG